MADGDTCAPPTFYFYQWRKKHTRHNELLKIRTVFREADNRFTGESLLASSPVHYPRLFAPFGLLAFTQNALTGNAINQIGEYARIRVKGIA